MKHQNILSLLVIAAAVVTTFAPPATADLLTSPTGTTYTDLVTANAEGHAVLDNPIATISCASTVSGEVESHGAGKRASGEIGLLTFGSPVGTCTNNWHEVLIPAQGSLSVEHTSGYDGTVFSTGATIQVTRFKITCLYATNNTLIGTLTGGSPATLHIEAAIPRHGGSFLCGDGSTTWTGSYQQAHPSSLFVDNS